MYLSFTSSHVGLLGRQDSRKGARYGVSSSETTVDDDEDAAAVLLNAKATTEMAENRFQTRISEHENQIEHASDSKKGRKAVQVEYLEGCSFDIRRDIDALGTYRVEVTSQDSSHETPSLGDRCQLVDFACFSVSSG
jgi:hypothetical protein